MRTAARVRWGRLLQLRRRLHLPSAGSTAQGTASSACCCPPSSATRQRLADKSSRRRAAIASTFMSRPVWIVQPTWTGELRYALLLASVHLTSALHHSADPQDAPRPRPGPLSSRSSLPRPHTPRSLLAAWLAQRSSSSSDGSSAACARLRGSSRAREPGARRLWPAAHAAQRSRRERVAVALPHSQGRVRATLAGAAARLASGAGAAGHVCLSARLARWRGRGDARGAALRRAGGTAGARGCACARACCNS